MSRPPSQPSPARGEGSRARKEWRQTDTPFIASLDVIGLRHFIYGGDPEWVRRRWFMVMSLTVGLVSVVAACISTALGRLPVELTKAAIEGYFSVIMAVVPAYILGSVWQKNKEISSGVSTEETTERVVEEGPPAKTTETTTKTVAPRDAGEPE